MHVYSHLFGTLGQYPIPAPFVRNPPVLRTPPTRTLPCSGTLSLSEGHVHSIFAYQTVNPLTNLQVQIPSIYYEGIVQVSWQDVRANVAKSYTTTSQNNHIHQLQLTAADFSLLRSGGTVTTVTSVNRAPSGRLHTHTVILSCVRQKASLVPNY